MPAKKTVTPEVISSMFWERTIKRGPNECWPWKNKPACKQGYGMLRVGRKWVRYAHRVSYELHNGELPEHSHEGPYVLHTCDNPICVNPHHLYLGSPRQNSDDMMERERQCRGSERPSAKLSEEDIPAIRQMAGSQRAIARIYGVSNTAIHAIKVGKKWKHI
jgi:hypothetical protein